MKNAIKKKKRQITSLERNSQSKKKIFKEKQSNEKMTRKKYFTKKGK